MTHCHDLCSENHLLNEAEYNNVDSRSIILRLRKANADANRHLWLGDQILSCRENQGGLQMKISGSGVVNFFNHNSCAVPRAKLSQMLPMLQVLINDICA